MGRSKNQRASVVIRLQSSTAFSMSSPDPQSTKDPGFSRVDLITLMAILGLLMLLFIPAVARSRINDQAFACLNNMRQLTAAWRVYADDHENVLLSTWTWIGGVLNYSANNADNTNVALLRNGQLGPYLQNPAVYKCPADRSVAQIGSVTYPRARTTSMSQMFRTDGSGGWSTAPPWTIYKKASDLINPIPARLWLMLDENPDSINDASFAVDMSYQGANAAWVSGPSMLHNGGCSFSFADGHGELKAWTDRRTVTRPMATTYTASFPFGLIQPYNPDIQWVQDRTTVRQ